jgi:hypothetical protein
MAAVARESFVDDRDSSRPHKRSSAPASFSPADGA